MAASLTTTEQSRLVACEKVIARGLGTFVEVGRALGEIRDSKLYRIEYERFADYCQERWDMGRSYAYRLIDSAAIADHLSPMGDILPSSERQCRPLTTIRKGKVIDVKRAGKAWEAVVKKADGEPITAEQVKEEAQKYRPKKPQKPPVDEGKAAEAILRESGEDALIALVDVGDRQGRLLSLPQALEILERLKDGRLTRLKFDAHVKAGVPGVREALQSTPEKPKRSRAEQLGPEWVELRTLLIDARKLLAGWTRQQKSVAQFARTHPNKGLAEKALKAVEQLSADLFVIEEDLRKCLKG